eukprot:3886882-Rhodomonas_salina.5
MCLCAARVREVLGIQWKLPQFLHERVDCGNWSCHVLYKSWSRDLNFEIEARRTGTRVPGYP